MEENQENKIGRKPRFILDGLSITRRENTIWIEGRDEALSGDTAQILHCRLIDLATASGYGLAVGSREFLEGVDAIVKIVSDPWNKTDSVNLLEG